MDKKIFFNPFVIVFPVSEFKDDPDGLCSKQETGEARYLWFGTVCIELNEEHQRMMVDPMFMIVQNARLFLTVTPIADILDYFEPY